MKDKADIKIAGSLTIKCWEELRPKLNVIKDELWSFAFSFFEQRITTRYLNPINQILKMDLNTGEGFAVVNLQCSLIETIECFYNGWIYEYPKYKRNNVVVKDPDGSNSELKSKDIFISFFKRRQPFKEMNIDGADFYIDVRCGLLHETQTKKGWRINDNSKGEKFYEEKNNEKIIYRENFQAALEKVIEEYKENIVKGGANCKDLRENYLAKFDHICLVS